MHPADGEVHSGTLHARTAEEAGGGLLVDAGPAAAEAGRVQAHVHWLLLPQPV
jgi:hypothetical protein